MTTIITVKTDKALRQYPRIYCFVMSEFLDIDKRPTLFEVTAFTIEDGVIAKHISDGEQWAMSDIGYTSTRKHDRYLARYPDGFEIEWVDDPLSHPVLSQYLRKGGDE